MPRKGFAQPRAMVAAASRVPLNKPPRSKPQPAAWQKDARVAAEIPEIKQLIRWRGNQLAKLHLYAAALPLGAGPDAEPVPVTDEATGIPPAVGDKASEVLSRFRSKIGGQAEILRRLETNLSKVGEAWVVYLAPKDEVPPDEQGRGGSPAEAEEWTVCSISEVEYKAERYLIKRSPGVRDEQARTLVTDEDDLFRVWEPDDEWFELSDCALKGCIDDAETLALLASQVKAEARSGTPALILCVPNELSFAPTAPMDGEYIDGEPADPFQRELEEHLDGAGDPTSRKTLVPLLLRGPGEHMTPDRLRTLDLSRKPDPTVDKRIEQSVLRIARGMDSPVEVARGLDNTTFSNAEQVSIDTWTQFLEPRAVFIVDAITVGFFRSALIDAGVDEATAERIFVWFDASDLVAQPDQEANADAAYDRNEISGEAYRRVKGYDDADAPEALEILVRTALRRGQLLSPAVMAMLESLAAEGGVTLPTPEEMAGPVTSVSQLAALLALSERAGRNGTNGATPVLATALARPSGQPAPPGARLAAIDRELRTRLLVLADDAMGRALEKAGSRLRGRAGPTRDRLRSIAPRLCASTLGEALIAEAGFTDADLLAGAFDAVEADFLTLGALAQGEALDILSSFVGGLSVTQREAVELRHANDLAGAWAWLKDALLGLAAARLYDPDPAIPTVGEHDPTLSVPPGVIRSALALAGGAAGLVPSGKGDGLLFRSGGVEPAGGIATGETMRDVLRDAGGRIEGWVWSYGPALRQRPFEPHVSLDGMSFASFDDDVLASDGTFYDWWIPGDHAGCVCSALPSLLPPDEIDPWGRGPNVPIPEV